MARSGAEAKNSIVCRDVCDFVLASGFLGGQSSGS